MRLLIIHTIAWSHYKAIVFNELYKICKQKDIDMKVIHIALNGKERKKIGKVDLSVHLYPYEILFQKFLEETNYKERTFAMLKAIHNYRPDIIAIPGWNDPVYLLIILFSKIFGKRIIL